VIRIRFSSAAERDLREAQAWYADQSPGLDLAFQRELDRCLDLIRAHPEGFPILFEAIRRANLHKFPYGIFYVQRKDHLFVLGVVHHARDPRVWKRRW
jgi:plasmid stabilization system protein ParE